MKQAGYSKRPQGRSSERHRPHHKQTYGDSNENKNRGNPQQFVEKYLLLARDAASSGDPVSAENYYQYADHYYRLALANRISRMPRPEKHGELRDSQSTPVVESTGDIPSVAHQPS